jgi:hypothetical protein
MYECVHVCAWVYAGTYHILSRTKILLTKNSSVRVARKGFMCVNLNNRSQTQKLYRLEWEANL